MNILQGAQWIIGILSIILLGVFAALNLYDRNKNDKSSYLTSLDEKTISALKSRLDTVEKDANIMADNHARLQKYVETLQIKHDELERLIDPGIKERQSEINGKLDILVKLTTKNNDNIEKLFKAIERHLDNGKSK